MLFRMYLDCYSDLDCLLEEWNSNYSGTHLMILQGGVVKEVDWLELLTWIAAVGFDNPTEPIIVMFG